MRKLTWLFPLAILGAGLLSGWGCAKKSDHLVLHCLGWGGIEEAKILQQAVDEFTKAHPDVEVKLDYVPFGDYITKVLTLFSAGLAPDVMAVNAEQMVSFASRGVFADLKPFVDKDPSMKLSDFYPEAIDHYTYNGLLTAIPRDIAPVAVIYYNKKKFDEAGLPYPKDNWTYQDLLADAQKLTKKGPAGRATQYGFVDDYPNWRAWTFAFGGSLVDNEKHPTRCTLDSPQAIAGIQFRADLMNKYGVTPNPSGLTAMGGMDTSDLFLNGTAAMFHSGIWVVPKFRQIKNFDWDVVEFPKGPHGHRGFPLSAAGYGIVKTCAHPEMAYELVKFLAGEVGQKFMAATGLTQPALLSVAHSPVFLDGKDPKSKKFLLDAVKDGVFEPLDPHVDEWTKIVQAELDRVWSGKETAAKALTKVTKEVNEKFFPK